MDRNRAEPRHPGDRVEIELVAGEAPGVGARERGLGRGVRQLSEGMGHGETAPPEPLIRIHDADDRTVGRANHHLLTRSHSECVEIRRVQEGWVVGLLSAQGIEVPPCGVHEVVGSPRNQAKRILGSALA